VLTGCATAHPAERPLTAPAAPRVARAVLSGEALCAQITEEAERAGAKAEADARRQIKDPEDAKNANLESTLQCLPGATSAWALLSADLTGLVDDGRSVVTEARLTLVHVDRAGVRVEWALPEAATLMTAYLGAPKGGVPGANCCQQYSYHPFPKIALDDDFDGDGEPEVKLTNEYSWEGSDQSYLGILSARGGTIHTLITPPDGATVEDVDGDGRKDVVYPVWASGSSCGSGFPKREPALSLLQHTLPDGTRSEDDAAAKAYARKQCPAAPAAIASPHDAACARLWGVAEAEVVRRIALTCAKSACPDDAPGSDATPACEDHDERVSAAGARLPFVLGGP
jgi:hypothetical protein